MKVWENKCARHTKVTKDQYFDTFKTNGIKAVTIYAANTKSAALKPHKNNLETE